MSFKPKYNNNYGNGNSDDSGGEGEGSGANDDTVINRSLPRKAQLGMGRPPALPPPTDGATSPSPPPPHYQEWHSGRKNNERWFVTEKSTLLSSLPLFRFFFPPIIFSPLGFLFSSLYWLLCFSFSIIIHYFIHYYSQGSQFPFLLLPFIK